MFVDEVKVKLIAWAWGDGLVSWRREKYIPKGWPRWGDGGNGASIILHTNPNINTLSEFRYKKVIKAQNGEKWGTQLMHGANAENLILEVPVGTLVKDAETKELIVDLSDKNISYVIVYGWRGGYGNAHFVSSTRQAPWFAEIWDIGGEKEVILELKLVADIGIIGIPSAGKSSLIASITSVKPKVGDYPFTTLIPNLWVLEHKEKNLVLEDVPGLIPWASQGKWLGIQFLKHIERTKVLLHLLDLSRLDTIFKDYENIRKELSSFSQALEKKEEIVVFSKWDLLDPEMKNYIQEEFKKKYPKKKTFLISAATGEGLRELKDFLIETYVEEIKENQEQQEEKEVKVYNIEMQEDTRNYNLNYFGDYLFSLSGKRIEQIVRMTDFSNKEAVLRLYDVFDKIGILKKVESEIKKEIRDNDDYEDDFEEIEEEKLPIIKVAGRDIPLKSWMGRAFL